MKHDYLLTEITALQRIKKLQYRNLVNPAGVIILSFVLNFILPALGFISTIALIMAIAGLIWFFIITNMHRIRNKILAPQPDTIYCPITGKVSQIRTFEDTTQISIRKSFLDTVEIRCPHESCVWEDGKLQLELDGTRIQFRFTGSRVILFTEAEMKPGQVIGAIIGNGFCDIQMPVRMAPLLSSGKIVDGGESWLYKEDFEPLPLMNK
ncbi:MAG TPA: hypothetical protein PL188_08865 [Candidatus Cloacimonadota bacterium]|nr:hypothetical protein [Candidatus Cloacimonadota bacterium]